MHTTTRDHLLACEGCRNGEPLGFDFTMAFQPIVDLRSREVFGYEALVRGTGGEGAAAILSQVTPANRYRFDQTCRVKAVELASRLGLTGYLSINFMPNAIYEPATCIRTTLAAANRHDFPTDRRLFEVSEGEASADKSHLTSILTDYAQRGFKTAIDDFGAGYAGLGLLAEFQPHFIKLDMDLIRDVDYDPVRQAIIRAQVSMCAELGVQVIAEGIESRAESSWLLEVGVHLQQGYLFARPGYETLPTVTWP